MRTISRKRALVVAPVAVLFLVGIGVAVWHRDIFEAVVVALLTVVGGLAYLAAVAEREGRAAQKTMLRRLDRLEARTKQATKVAQQTRRSSQVVGDRVEVLISRTPAKRLDEVISGMSDLLQEELAELSAGVEGKLASLNSRLGEHHNVIKPALDGYGHQLTTIRKDVAAMELGERGGSLRKRLSGDVAALFAMYADEPRQLMPIPVGWAMSPQVLEFVLRKIRTAPRLDTVVELGSGVSTPWIAQALNTRGSGRLVSFEHDEHYAAITSRQLQAVGLESFVELRCEPLAAVELSGETFSWYQGYKDLANVDLLIVDGPPGGTGPLARYPALPILLDKISDGGIVILDDAIRDDEDKIIERWTRSGDEGRSVALVDRVDRAAVLQVGAPG